MIETILATIGHLTQEGAAWGGRLNDYGINLLAGLMLIQFCLILFPHLLAGNGLQAVLADAIRLGLNAAIIAFFIRNSAELGGELVKGMDLIAQKILGGRGENAFSVSLAKFFEVAGQQWHITSGGDDPSVLDFILKVATGITVFVLNNFTLLVVMIAGFIAFANYIYSQILLLIVLAFIPILLPFFILQKTQSYAEGSINFLMKAALMMPIGIVMMSLSLSLLSKSAEIANHFPGITDLDRSLAVLIMSFATGLMMLKVPDIASSILSGGGVSSGGRLIPSSFSFPRPSTGGKLPGGKPPIPKP